MNLLLAISVLGKLASALPDSNLVANPGFESGATKWSFWARSSDSATAGVVGAPCRTGTGCYQVRHWGSQDWALSPANRQAVQTGQVWEWSLWARLDSTAGGGVLSFVTRDSAKNVLGWAVAGSNAPVDTGWQLLRSRIVVPRGVAFLDPRLIGYGSTRMRVDDAEFHLLEPAPSAIGETSLRNDSLRVRIDPLDFSLTLRDSIGGDSSTFGAVDGWRIDSLVRRGDTLVASGRELATGAPISVEAWLKGGSLRLVVHGDSIRPMPEEWAFPGVLAVRPGQFLVSPRGTGLLWPVDAATNPWSQTTSRYWDWQVTQALSGVTDGKTGCVVSMDQPWSTLQRADRGMDGLLHPRTYLAPNKGVWGHDRSLVISPLRGGGFPEMARRHRARQIELGRFRTWTQKVAANPKTERLRGAVDFWFLGDWPRLRAATIDSMRAMGMERALVDWSGATAAQLDTLDANGWLTTHYDNYADAYPTGKTPRDALYPAGIIQLEDGSAMKGWLGKNSDGTPNQAYEICSSTHGKLARDLLELEQKTVRRNARFIDVQLAIGLEECFSPVHPVDRHRDAINRDEALAVVHDSFHLVTGSEQTRDFAFSHVDWGEGSMSVAVTANAGYDWGTPVPPEPLMDTLSMDPAIRVPLLPLASHDGFAPTWYTGDGQSKVPARWDDKDAWNALYATMPLVMPTGRRMWDSLLTRYMRTVNLLGAVHSRIGFEPMTDFAFLSEDRRVQKTSFTGGWTVSANFDGRDRSEASVVLPSKGFLATNGAERVERTYLDGAIRSRVRLSDRWFLDPEGSQASIDGLRTDGAVFLRRQTDSTIHLALIGNQQFVDLAPLSLPWPSSDLTVQVASTGSAVGLSAQGGGWVRLVRSGNERFYKLKGHFGALDTDRKAPGANSKLFLRSGRWVLQRLQPYATNVRLRVMDIQGRQRESQVDALGPGWGQWEFSAQGPAWILLEDGNARETYHLPF